MLHTRSLAQFLNLLNTRMPLAQAFHRNSPEFTTPRNEEFVSRSYEKILRVRWLVCMRHIVRKTLKCNMIHNYARRDLGYYRVKHNDCTVTPRLLDTSPVEVGDFFTVDGQVNEMDDGIVCRTFKAEVVDIAKRNRALELPTVLRRGEKMKIKGLREKWNFELKIRISIITKRYFRKVKYSEIPKKGMEAFKLLLQLSKPSDNVYGRHPISD